MAAALFGSLAFSQNAFAGIDISNKGQEKITICHVDQETGEEKTITIGAPSVPKHLANHAGDHEGECMNEPEPFCGDDNLDANEQCDDGNNANGDGCDSQCIIEQGPSTCEECVAVYISHSGDCAEDFDCEKAALQELADCTSTCEGQFNNIPQFCWNLKADVLSSCLDSATDQTDNATCLVDVWGAQVTACAGLG